MTDTFTLYCRTSTSDQKLGLIAQQDAMERYIASVSGQVVKVFIEQASGGNNERPVFDEAVNHAVLTGSVLTCKETSRFSRNTAFAMKVMETPGLRVLFTDTPSSCEFIDTIGFALGAKGREHIKIRTKAALDAKREDEPDWKPGNPDREATALCEWIAENGNGRAVEVVKRNADAFAERYRKPIMAMRSSGIRTAKAIGAEMRARGYLTRRGGQWHETTVRNLLKRLEISLAMPAM